ncbi:hypothetical protein KM043_007333 [Ampulex compressa]|nr:hypothetical protein KM043_007333 [Ampulex compressa]
MPERPSSNSPADFGPAESKRREGTRREKARSSRARTSTERTGDILSQGGNRSPGSSAATTVYDSLRQSRLGRGVTSDPFERPMSEIYAEAQAYAGMQGA